MKRTAFFVSDSTGITAETLGQSLLAQFDNIEFQRVILPYVDSVARAQAAVDRINRSAREDGAQPIVFDTIVNHDIKNIIAQSDGLLLDILATFLAPLEQALGSRSNYMVGRGQITANDKSYEKRISAVHYALDNDDGARVNRYDDAELILIGVSRSGKTPTCLYLAMQAGIYAANYPLTDEDLESASLPAPLKQHRSKLYGLTIDPERLAAIRNERRSNSRYASLSQCEDEVRQAERLFQRNGIGYIDTTHISIEEIATRILVETGLRERR
ncbi:MAG TPA: pyruvate, water dikinase regulatory protein [Spongiibacteraceae bacterium]|jgi:regulator of PEP synthase PpsR (kinase-PPPase family)|nr:pyruvate, water dikinase regulatory protein [Spongiibacteraceae bacterium]HUH39152.1 pyruvate, water dikinase regulatory protein [Spongiibacteraceae bacterium]